MNGSAIRRPARRRLIVLPAIAAVTLIAAGVVALMNFSTVIPAPSGPNAVGTISVELARASTAPPGTFQLTVWYPSEAAADRAPYSSDGGGLRGFVLRRLIRTHAARSAPVAAAPATFPVLVYQAGWGGRRSGNTVLAQELASRGFVVAAVDDIAYEAPPPPGLGGPLDLSSEAAYRATLVLARARLAYAAQRLSFVIDELFAPDGPLPADVRSRLDPKRVGAFGYSFGGAIAFDAAQHDPRIRAVLNLDGWLFRDPAEALDRLRPVPYCVIGTLDPPVTSVGLAASDPVTRYTNVLNDSDGRIQERVLARGGVSVTITGTSHESFDDDLRLVPWGRSTGEIGNARVRTIVDGYVTAFFEEALDGRTSPLLATGAAADPAVAVRVWPFRS